MNVLSRRSTLAGLAAVALTLAGCGGDSMTGISMSAGTSMSTMSAAAGGTATSTASGSTADDTTHNDADVTFAQQMIEHHRGAVEMARLALDRAGSPEVADLAARIEAAQDPEIDLMTEWLQAWGSSMGGTAMDMDMGGSTAMDMSSAAGTDMSGTATAMLGMMSADEMAALTAATGPAFDTLFLQMMVVHHEGALQMAQTELAEGANPQALSLARAIIESQTAEIAEMQQLLAAG